MYQSVTHNPMPTPSCFSYQEDSHAIATLTLEPRGLQAHLAEQLGILSWDPRKVGPELAGQVVFVGIYDGHGGPSVSQFLQRELHGLFETVQPDSVPDVVSWMKSQGRYYLVPQTLVSLQMTEMHRWLLQTVQGWCASTLGRAGFRVTNVWIRGTGYAGFSRGVLPTLLYIVQHSMSYSMAKADKRISELPESEKCGATSSILLLHSLESPATPFFSSHNLCITVAHCGYVSMFFLQFVQSNLFQGYTSAFVCN
jgi:protein phosphatase PTC6